MKKERQKGEKKKKKEREVVKRWVKREAKGNYLHMRRCKEGCSGGGELLGSGRVRCRDEKRGGAYNCIPN